MSASRSKRVWISVSVIVSVVEDDVVEAAERNTRDDDADAADVLWRWQSEEAEVWWGRNWKPSTDDEDRSSSVEMRGMKNCCCMIIFSDFYTLYLVFGVREYSEWYLSKYSLTLVLCKDDDFLSTCEREGAAFLCTNSFRKDAGTDSDSRMKFSLCHATWHGSSTNWNRFHRPLTTDSSCGSQRKGWHLLLILCPHCQALALWIGKRKRKHKHTYVTQVWISRLDGFKKYCTW